MELTDEELDTVHSCLYDQAYYGDDNIVYGSEGDILRAALAKVTAEAERRKLW